MNSGKDPLRASQGDRGTVCGENEQAGRGVGGDQGIADPRRSGRVSGDHMDDRTVHLAELMAPATSDRPSGHERGRMGRSDLSEIPVVTVRP